MSPPQVLSTPSLCGCSDRSTRNLVVQSDSDRIVCCRTCKTVTATPRSLKYVVYHNTSVLANVVSTNVDRKRLLWSQYQSKGNHAQSRSLTLTSLLYALLRLIKVLWCMCLGELLHLSTHLRHEPLSGRLASSKLSIDPSTSLEQQTANCILQIHSQIFAHTHFDSSIDQSVAYFPSRSHHVRLASRSAQGFHSTFGQTVQHAHRRESHPPLQQGARRIRPYQCQESTEPGDLLSVTISGSGTCCVARGHRGILRRRRHSCQQRLCEGVR